MIGGSAQQAPGRRTSRKERGGAGTEPAATPDGTCGAPRLAARPSSPRMMGCSGYVPAGPSRRRLLHRWANEEI
jgi:hypothetical protein